MGRCLLCDSVAVGMEGPCPELSSPRCSDALAAPCWLWVGLRWAMGAGEALAGTHRHAQDIPETQPQLSAGKGTGKASQAPPAQPGIHSWMIQMIFSLSRWSQQNPKFIWIQSQIPLWL